MVNTITVQCNSCRSNMQIKIPIIKQQRERIALLESVLRSNHIHFYSPERPNTYGKYIDLFI